MQLTEQQNDALTELINIAFSRTAAALSEITGQRVLIGAPQVAISPIGELAATLSQFIEGQVTSIHQVFSGPVGGDALLLLNREGASALSDLLTGGDGQAQRLDASGREVLTKVGNILLNACLGMFGDLLHVHLRFAVPLLHLEELDDLLKSLVVGKDELRYALVVHTTFNLRDSAIGGYLVIVLGVTSLDRLLQAVETWEEEAMNTRAKASP